MINLTRMFLRASVYIGLASCAVLHQRQILGDGNTMTAFRTLNDDLSSTPTRKVKSIYEFTPSAYGLTGEPFTATYYASDLLPTNTWLPDLPNVSDIRKSLDYLTRTSTPAVPTITGGEGRTATLNAPEATDAESGADTGKRCYSVSLVVVSAACFLYLLL